MVTMPRAVYMRLAAHKNHALDQYRLSPCCFCYLSVVHIEVTAWTCCHLCLDLTKESFIHLSQQKCVIPSLTIAPSGILGGSSAGVLARVLTPGRSGPVTLLWLAVLPWRWEEPAELGATPDSVTSRRSSTRSRARHQTTAGSGRSSGCSHTWKTTGSFCFTCRDGLVQDHVKQMVHNRLRF